MACSLSLNRATTKLKSLLMGLEPPYLLGVPPIVPLEDSGINVSLVLGGVDSVERWRSMIGGGKDQGSRLYPLPPLFGLSWLFVGFLCLSLILVDRYIFSSRAAGLPRCRVIRNTSNLDPNFVAVPAPWPLVLPRCFGGCPVDCFQARETDTSSEGLLCSAVVSRAAS